MKRKAFFRVEFFVVLFVVLFLTSLAITSAWNNQLVSETVQQQIDDLSERVHLLEMTQ